MNKEENKKIPQVSESQSQTIWSPPADDSVRLQLLRERYESGDNFTSEEIQDILDSGYIERIVKILPEKNTEILDVLEFLFEYSRDFTDEVQLYKVNGLVTHLMILLSNENEKIRTYCAGTLSHLAHNPVNGFRLYQETQIIDQIMEIFRDNQSPSSTSRQELYEAALNLLCKIASSSKDDKNRTIGYYVNIDAPNIPCALYQRDHVVERVFEMLLTPYAPVQVASASVLVALTIVHENQIHLYEMTGLVDRVFYLLENSLNTKIGFINGDEYYDEEYWREISFNLQENLLALLMNLSDTPVNQRKLFERPNILYLLGRFLELPREEIQINAAGVLWNLSNDKENQRAIYLREDLKNRLIELMRISNQSVRRNIAGTLWNLSENKENAKDLFVEEGTKVGYLNNNKIMKVFIYYFISHVLFQKNLVDILHGDIEWHYMKFRVPFLSFLYSCGIVEFYRCISEPMSSRIDSSSTMSSSSSNRCQGKSAVMSVCECDDLRREYILSYL